MPSNTLTNAVQVKYILHVKISGYLEHKIPIIIGTRSYTDARSYEEMGRHIGISEQSGGKKIFEITKKTIPSIKVRMLICIIITITRIIKIYIVFYNFYIQ